MGDGETSPWTSSSIQTIRGLTISPSTPVNMEGPRHNTANKRVLLAKLLAVITKHSHWQRTWSDHCYVEAQLRQHTNRIFDGLDLRLPLMESRPPTEPAAPVSPNLIDPCFVPLPLDSEREAIITNPFAMLMTPPLTPPGSTISWDVMSNPFACLRSFSGMSEAGSVADAASKKHTCFPMDLERPYDQAFYPELPLGGPPDQIRHPELDPDEEQNLQAAHDDDKVWQLQMQFVFRGEVIEVWRWLEQRSRFLHPSHISLQWQLAVIKSLEDYLVPPIASQLMDAEAEANDNLALMTKEIAGLELSIDRMSRVLDELEREDRDPFTEPISVVLFD
ncbi:uncharacterized protein QC761_120414 [Podospora bellae-mahoneyi]|uniref:Uncharacterized protein n=1 Tax=Podospora bellae-mahoneyi TaxID=2093777 RepID=A0ABR0G1R7_9PEZI|nr:hypothetical protein QC761_120414 [Podospora bellae-mahoneyi]